MLNFCIAWAINTVICIIIFWFFMDWDAIVSGIIAGLAATMIIFLIFFGIACDGDVIYTHTDNYNLAPLENGNYLDEIEGDYLFAYEENGSIILTQGDKYREIQYINENEIPYIKVWEVKYSNNFVNFVLGKPDDQYTFYVPKEKIPAALAPPETITQTPAPVN